MSFLLRVQRAISCRPVRIRSVLNFSSSIPSSEESEDVWLPKDFSEIPLTEDLSIDYPKPSEVAPVEEYWEGDPKGLPVMVETCRVMRSGAPNVDAPEERQARLWARIDQLKLDEADQKSLAEILGPRYNPNTRTLKLTSNKYPSPDENVQHCADTLKALIAEAKQLTKLTSDTDQ